MKNKSILIAALCATALGGCANTLRGGPDLVSASVEGPNADTRFTELKTAIEEHCFKINTPRLTRQQRNDLTDALLVIADRRYFAFERAFSNESRGGTFLASFASIGLTTAGALSGENAAQTLATLDTALKGSTQAFSKDFLFDQTVPALQNQMEASRAKIEEVIQTRKEAPVERWSTCNAVKDVMAYEQAGTLIGAIADITAAASEEKREAEKDLEETKEAIIAACDVINPETAVLNLRFRELVGTADGENAELRLKAAEALKMELTAGTVPTWPELANAFDQALCDDARKKDFLDTLDPPQPAPAEPAPAEPAQTEE